MIHGLIVINKTTSITSHDVVSKVRKVFKTKKVGHFGTLDPLAEGVLLIGIGHVTKYFNFFLKKKKNYFGEITFGFATDTYDKLGKPTSEKKNIDLDQVDQVKLRKKFLGTIEQYPPKFSAKKKNGKPLYKYAREEIEVEIQPSTVTIFKLKTKVLKSNILEFEAQTSEGTYIRSIAHDMGQNLGCGAHLSKLTRTSVGDFLIDNALPFDKLQAFNMEELINYVIPIEELLPDFPKITIHPQAEKIVENGGLVREENISNVQKCDSEYVNVRIFNIAGTLMAIAKKNPDGLKPFLVFHY